MQSSPYIIIVDPVNWGSNFIRYAKNMGYNVISVYTLGEDFFTSKNYLTKEKQKISEKEFFETDLGKLLPLLKDYNIKAVVPATEPGVELAALLGKQLGLPYTAEPEDIVACRDKHLMRQILKKHQLSKVNFRLCAHEENVQSFVRENKFTVILKPLRSSGGDNFHQCYSLEECYDALQK
mmetsp:Transcript_6246/g.14077  ORF Transcript_6246/g.14077 Transcript_6246/m.14077 type:complete len:180 (-) Transcript_6246:4922-5461(-)